MPTNPQFYNRESAMLITRNRVPHWEQAGACYFVTFRLNDAVPAEALSAFVRDKQDWLAAHPESPWSRELEIEYQQRFNTRFERWLDSGFGSNLLASPQHASIVADTMRYFEGERSQLHAWVVMPTHIHALVSLLGQTTLSNLIKSWKSYSARQINQSRDQSGSIWQKSYFDQIIRDWDHFQNCARYIRNNPKKAKLVPGTYLHAESEQVRILLSNCTMS